MMNWIVVVLFTSIILKELKILKELVIPSKKKAIEIIFLVAGILVLVYITYAYAKTKMHYLLAVLGITLYIVGYLKQGITLNGFASVHRSLQFIPWNKVQKVYISTGKSIKVLYCGDGFSGSLYFKNEDYDRLIGLLNEKLPNCLPIIDYH